MLRELCQTISENEITTKTVLYKFITMSKECTDLTGKYTAWSM